MPDNLNEIEAAPSSYVVEELGWDTNYFGYKSARVILKNELSEKEWIFLLNKLAEYEFVTINNLNNNNNNNNWIGRNTTAFLTDLNCKFKKKISISLEKNTYSVSVDNKFLWNEDIIQIADNAFRYSRFFNDNNLNDEKKKAVYSEWVKNAFEQKGKYFVTYTNEDEIVGFLLFSINESDLSASIELLAVNNKYKNKKIGKTLINELEIFLDKKSMKYIIVGTQIDNVPAMNFYFTNGFQLESRNSIFHYWPKFQTKCREY